MGTIIGVVVGYALGTRAGAEGWTEFEASWKVISNSEEVRDLLMAGLVVARQFLGRGSQMLASALETTGAADRLRPVA